MRIGDKPRLIDVRTSFLVLHASFPFQTKRRRFRAGDQPREAAVGQEEEGSDPEAGPLLDEESRNPLPVHPQVLALRVAQSGHRGVAGMAHIWCTMTDVKCFPS